MSTDQSLKIPPGNRFRNGWQTLARGYRTLNDATYHVLGWTFKLAVVIYFVFCAAFLGLRYVVLPNIDNYKPDVEAAATRVVGSKVSIRDIDAAWDGLRPYLALDDVVIYDKAGKEALQLPKVKATVAWLSAIIGEVRLHRLEIDRPEMDVTRDAQGNLVIGGIFIDMHKKGSSKAADWILSQDEIAIHGGKLRWKDELREAPPLSLDGVEFLLRNRWHRHRFALKATPPLELAAPLDIRATFDHPHFSRNISDPLLWKGQLYADVRNTDIAAWKAWLDYPIEVVQGQGSVRAWLDFDHAKVADFTADLSLVNVSTRLRKDLALLNLVRADGRVAVREEFNANSADGTPTFGANGHAISLTDFSLQTEDGLQLAPTTMSESYTPARKGKPEKTALVARQVDLKTLAEFAERLPLTAEQHRMLDDFAPRGVLKNFALQWQGAYPNIATYSVKGDFEDLALNPQAPRPAIPKSEKTSAQAAVPGIPGFDNLRGSIEANDKGGTFRLDSQKLKLQFPGYFASPDMPFDSLQMQVNWAFKDKNSLRLEVNKFAFIQGALAGSLHGTHLMPLKLEEGKSHGVMDVSGSLTGFNVADIETYLPTMTPAATKAWLTDALVDGTAEDVRIKIKGDLADFPFQPRASNGKPRGEFLVQGKIKGGVLNYVPNAFGKDGKAPMWPLLQDIDGSIVFDRARMEIRAAKAKTHGANVSNVKAVIEDLSTHSPLLQITGEAEGNLSDMVAYVNDSPVAGMTNHLTEETKANGNARLGLKLDLPLAKLEDTKVNGTLHLQNDSVALLNGLPPMTGTVGKFEFSEKGFNLDGIKANFLGGPIVVAGGMAKDGAINVKANGTATAIGLRRAYSLPAWQSLTERVAGSTRYNALIRVKNGHPDVTVESNLAGLALDLPAPLRKVANDVMPLKFELLGLPSNDNIQRDEMRLALGPAVAARYERQKTADKGAEWRVVRGGLGVNVPVPTPDSGVLANVNLKSLNIDEWTNLVSVTKTDGSAGKTADVSGIDQYVAPDIVTFRTSELTIFQKKLANVVVGSSRRNGVWQANIDSDQVSGYLTWTQPRFGRGLGKVTARLSSLIIPQTEVSTVSELLDTKGDTQIPALDIVADNFELFGKKFGHLELAASNERGATGLEWQISKLSIVNPDADFKATGKWLASSKENLSSLNYTLNIADAGKLLERFGFANVLRGGKGKMEGDVNWKGLPFALDIPSLSGNMQMELASGQFMKVDPAAAKLLGVLNMQALPRRLTLDFRDVFSQGFAFDGISGTASITRGVAKTDSLKMRGVAATVLIDGTADIAHESQNLHVSVIPEINLGAASVAYGLAVNPVIGVGTLLAQMFLRDPLMKAFTYEYQITGAWKDPVVNKVARKNANEAAVDATKQPG